MAANNFFSYAAHGQPAYAAAAYPTAATAVAPQAAVAGVQVRIQAPNYINIYPVISTRICLLHWRTFVSMPIGHVFVIFLVP